MASSTFTGIWPDSRGINGKLRMYCTPSALRCAADIADRMDTPLWIDENPQKEKSMESLIAAGQATICFNLIVVAYSFEDDTKEWNDLKTALISDREKFQENPYWLQ